MTDVEQRLASLVREKTRELNEAIVRCHQVGLVVEVSALPVLGEAYSEVSARINRPIS